MASQAKCTRCGKEEIVDAGGLCAVCSDKVIDQTPASQIREVGHHKTHKRPGQANKEYQHSYYLQVTKPKRQAERRARKCGTL